MPAALRRPTLPLLVAVLGLWLVLRAVFNPIDHDIDQYVGGAMLVADGLTPFVDFIHLQTPLQTQLWAPVVAMAGDRAFAALHAVAIACGLGLIAITYAAGRRHGAGAGAALVAAALLALCEPFQYGATTLRNDALAGLFGAGGMAAALWSLRGGRRSVAFVAGLCWGLASSTKLSYLVVAGFGGGTLIWLAFHNRTNWRMPLFASAGGVVGLLPAITAFLASPEAFAWGVYGFASDAPFAWNLASGRHERLTLLNKAAIALPILAEGPALAAVVLLMLGRLVRREPVSPEVRLLDLLIVGGLVAALMPTPVQRGYFLPMLPPLFVRIAPYLAGWVRRRRRAPLVLLTIGLVAGLVRLPVLVGLAGVRGVPSVKLEREGAWIGETMRAAGRAGPIATLSPRLVMASGAPLDPRFATGVFVFRTGWLLTPAEARAYRVATPATLAAMLDAAPPAAIVTGYESGRPRFPLAPDAALVRYARTNRWPAVRSPHGRAILYLNPDARR